MNSGPILFLGMLGAMACSWATYVMSPQLQMGHMEPATNLTTQAAYPDPYEGGANQGAQVYRANGCVACHTQQIRAKEFGPDAAHYGALRQSVGYDYLFDQPVMLGEQRIGPDLSTVGMRTDRASLLLKLYDPRASAPGSVMPSYRYLFDTRKITFAPSPDAMKNLPSKLAPSEGYEVVPTPQAEQLVSYLLSRRQNAFVYFAPPPPTNAPGTNAPAASSAPKK